MTSLDRLLRPLAWGVFAGFALSLARAPLGLDLASTPAVRAGDAFLFRGLALVVVALALGRWPAPRPRVAPLLAGLALGFGLHGLLLGDALAPDSRLANFGLLAATLVVLRLIAGRERPKTELGEELLERPGVVERTALLVAGAGLAITLEAVARPLRLLGGALPADDSVFGFVFLLLLAFGALAFGPLLPRRLGEAVLPLLMVLAALACRESLGAIESFSTRNGLEGFLKRPPWRLDITHQGRLWGDVLIGSRVLLAPAFLLGTALSAARHRSRLAWSVFGAALGLLALPFVQGAVDYGEGAAGVPALRATLGGLLTAIGGIGAALAARGSRLRTRIGVATTCLLVAGSTLIGPRPEALPLSPWERFQVVPKLVLDAPEGLLTVEPTLDLGYVVTLDRRRLSPSPSEEAADEQRLRLAWERGIEPLRADDERRVLLVGQLTPARARVLRMLGASHVDRTAAWHEHMEALETILFDGEPRPPGRILAPSEIDREGPWSLIVVPPVRGAAPLLAPRRAELGPRVLWRSTGFPCAQAVWGESVRLSSAGVEDLCLAVDEPDGLPSGEPSSAPAPWRLLLTRPFEREAESVASAMRRLAQAARGGEWAALTEGLALHASVQVRSSPFETPAQQVEIDPDALRLLRDAALAREPDLFQRELWNGLGQVLADKREIELVVEHLAPLSERWKPWWQLELLLSRADLEALDPQSAAERLLLVAAARPLDLRARVLCADALSMAQRPAEAALQLREAERIQPGRRDVRRRLALALARAGSPDARPLIEELLATQPDDEELRTFLGDGPFPPVEVRYVPFEGEQDAHGH